MGRSEIAVAIFPSLFPMSPCAPQKNAIFSPFPPDSLIATEYESGPDMSSGVLRHVTRSDYGSLPKFFNGYRWIAKETKKILGRGG